MRKYFGDQTRALEKVGKNVSYFLRYVIGREEGRATVKYIRCDILEKVWNSVTMLIRTYCAVDTHIHYNACPRGPWNRREADASGSNRATKREVVHRRGEVSPNNEYPWDSFKRFAFGVRILIPSPRCPYRVHIIIPVVPRKNVFNNTRGAGKISAEPLYFFVPRLLIECYFRQHHHVVYKRVTNREKKKKGEGTLISFSMNNNYLWKKKKKKIPII